MQEVVPLSVSPGPIAEHSPFTAVQINTPARRPFRYWVACRAWDHLVKKSTISLLLLEKMPGVIIEMFDEMSRIV